MPKGTKVPVPSWKSPMSMSFPYEIYAFIKLNFLFIKWNLIENDNFKIIFIMHV